MKKYLSLLLALYSLSTIGQVRPNLPVDIGNTVTIGNNQISLLQLSKEGRLTSISSPAIATVSGSPPSTTILHGAALGGAAQQILVGRAFLVTSFNASASTGPIEVSGAFANVKAFGAFLTQQLSSFGMVIPSGGGMLSISPNQLIESEGSVTASMKWLGANNVPTPYVHATFTGIEFTADFNYTAKKRILIVGESTAWGTMGNDVNGVAYPKDSLWTFQLVRALNAEGKSVRHINKAFGGANSQHIAYAQRSGYLDVDYDLLIYNAIHNDKTNNTTQAIYQANLKGIIDHRNQHCPRASILFVSDFPQEQVGAADSRNANYRSWMQAVATGASFGGGTANRVYFIAANDAFPLATNATTDLNMTERIAGQRLHPSGLGQGIIFRTKIWPAVKLTDFYLNTKW